MSKLLIRFVMKSSFLANPALARRTREEERRRRRGREDWSGRRRRPSTRRPALEPSPGSTWLLSLLLSESSRVGKRAESAAAVASWFIAPPLGRGRGRGGVGVTCYVVDAPLVHATKVWGGHLGFGGGGCLKALRMMNVVGLFTQYPVVSNRTRWKCADVSGQKIVAGWQQQHCTRQDFGLRRGPRGPCHSATVSGNCPLWSI